MNQLKFFRLNNHCPVRLMIAPINIPNTRLLKANKKIESNINVLVLSFKNYHPSKTPLDANIAPPTTDQQNI